MEEGPKNNFTTTQYPLHPPITQETRLNDISDDVYQGYKTPTSRKRDLDVESGEIVPEDQQIEPTGWFHAKFRPFQLFDRIHNLKLQLLVFFLFAIGLSVTIVFADRTTASIGLLTGGSITIVTCSLVIYTFVTRTAWRAHPNPLIFYRSVCDLSLVVVLLSIEIYNCADGDCALPVLLGKSCRTVAGFTQFFLFASESWFFVMAIDMMQSIRSPFTDYKSNIRKYHFFVWGASLITAIVIVSIEDAAGQSEFGYCWTLSAAIEAIEDPEKEDGFWNLNTRSWLFFYIFLIVYWIFGIGVVSFAWRRLKDGLNETLRMRLRVLHSVTLYVIAIIIYWGLSFIVYVPYLILDVQKCSRDECEHPWLRQLMSFMIMCKGYFDFIVWFQLNQFKQGEGVFQFSGESKKNVDLDVDLNPQVNLALRREVLYYTTTGIIQAVRDTHHLPPGATQQELYIQPQGSDLRSDSLGVEDLMLDDQALKTSDKQGTLFIDYCPHTFRTIREHFGVHSSEYTDSLSKTTKERLSEGASGAFMFFSHDQKLIVKSMSSEEASFLRNIAADYAAYLLTHPDSLLTRFYGCHAIKLYGSTFYFVVMENLFASQQGIHRRYDIKGSWVNRSANRPSKGKRVTCRHCNASYVFGSTDAGSNNCPSRVGNHEPNTVLKDNDLTAKVRLDKDAAEELYEQLVMDSSFLARLGIMDYSLLLGVHNVEYIVNTAENKDRSRSIIDRGNVRCASRGAMRRRPSRPRSVTSETKAMMDKKAAVTMEEKPHEKGLPRVYTGTRRANTVVGPSSYYFGIIDILQTWSLQKRAERFAKVYFLGADSDGLSAVPPTVYKDRFVVKMADILGISLHNEEEAQPLESESGLGLSLNANQIDSPVQRRYM